MSASKICPQCSAEYALDQRFCPLDGSTLKTQGGADDLVGSVVADRYYVLRKLGEGGMGQVYLAEHVRMGRKSALKVMRPKMVEDAEAISRFNREASNASRISHPNVAAIYDFGETTEGLIYLAMEFVEGEALTQLVERTGALPPLRAADIIRQTADALASAHDMGIVHRDLKPDNIMVAKNRDGSDCVKVVDFGIAKSNEGSQKVTKTGLVVGTPEYMSPEQLAGDRLDGRSDTYSLGLVAFHVLTGHLPFPSESQQESMIMRLTDRPKRLADLRGDVAWPAALQAVMDRVLERDARLRYASAADFGREFARAVEAMPEAAAMAAGTQVVGVANAVPPTRVADASGVGRRGWGEDDRSSVGRRPSAEDDTLSVGRRPSAETAPGTSATASRIGPETAVLAAAPMGARGITGRTPMLAAAAVVAVLAVGAAAMQFLGGAPAEAGAQVDSLGAAGPARDGAGESPAREKTRVATVPDSAPPAEQFAQQVEATVPDPGVVEPAGALATPQESARDAEAAPAPVRDAPIGSNPNRRGRGANPQARPLRTAVHTGVLRHVEGMTGNPATARDAIVRLNRIAGTLTRGSDEYVWAQLLRAESHAALGQERQMCVVLGTIEGQSSNTTHNQRIAALREVCQ